MGEMEKEYPYAGYDGQNPRSLKRPWEMVDYSHSGLTGHWQDKRHQGERLCHPGSFGDTEIQMQMTSTIPHLPSNAASEPPGFMESSQKFSGLCEAPSLHWSNNGSGASPLNLQLSPDSWGECSLQPAAPFPASSGTVNRTKELWTFSGSPETLERLTDC